MSRRVVTGHRADGKSIIASDTAVKGIAMPGSSGTIYNFLWANDYPHHEGTWPHSAEAIERTMGMLNDTERAKILGLNAARIFGFEGPKKADVLSRPG